MPAFFFIGKISVLKYNVSIVSAWGRKGADLPAKT